MTRRRSLHGQSVECRQHRDGIPADNWWWGRLSLQCSWQTSEVPGLILVVRYSPSCFLKFFPNGWEFLSKILHAYCMFISMANYKILFNFFLSLTLTKLCHIKRNHPVNFHFSLEFELFNPLTYVAPVFSQCQCSILRRKATTNARWRLQTVASIWIHIQLTQPVRRSTGWEPTVLYRLHRKGRMATKFTRPQPTWLPCVGCNASGISQSSLKARDHSGAKKCTPLDLGWLAADNDQQSY